MKLAFNPSKKIFLRILLLPLEFIFISLQCFYLFFWIMDDILNRITHADYQPHQISLELYPPLCRYFLVAIEGFLRFSYLRFIGVLFLLSLVYMPVFIFSFPLTKRAYFYVIRKLANQAPKQTEDVVKNKNGNISYIRQLNEDLAACQVYIKATNYKKAYDELGDFLNKNPNSSDGYLLLADLEARRGKIKNAEDAYKKAIKLDITRPLPRLLLSKFYIEREEYDKNIALLEKANEELIDSEISYQLGNAYLRAGKVRKALIAMNNSLKLKKNAHQVRIRMADVLINLKQYSLASQLLYQVIEDDKHNYNANILLACIFKRKGLPYSAYYHAMQARTDKIPEREMRDMIVLQMIKEIEQEKRGENPGSKSIDDTNKENISNGSTTPANSNKAAVQSNKAKPAQPTAEQL